MANLISVSQRFGQFELELGVLGFLELDALVLFADDGFQFLVFLLVVGFLFGPFLLGF